MCTRTACPRAVRRRSCEPEGETCARKHEQIVADGEFVVVHRRFSGFRRDEPDRCRLRSRSCSWGGIARSLHTPREQPRARTARVIATEEN
jgi:hypothetical protein